MRQNVINLEKFYASRLGEAARDMAMRRLQTVWPDISGRDILAFGYGYPYMEPYLSSAKRVILAMPAGQGAIAQYGARGSISCLTDDEILPFDDAQFDRVLVVHGLEETDRPSALLSELWRVIQPEGRIVIIAANRTGLWARSDKSPFGTGRPFSRFQLKSLLLDGGFDPIFWSGALYGPPVHFLSGPGRVTAMERFGELVYPGFSGLILVEAIKRLYAEPSTPKKQRVSRPIFGTPPIGTVNSDR